MKRLYLLLLTIGLLVSSACSQSKTDTQTDQKVSLDVKIGQMLNIGFRGMSVDESTHIKRDIRQYHLGGVTLFDYDVAKDTAYRNIRSERQLKRLIQELQQLSPTPLFIAIDQEGGKVARLKPKYGFPASVSAQYLGELNNLDSTRFYARQTAQTLADISINVNLAPVVDLNINPQNPVIGKLERSFSADPATVIKHASAYIDVLHDYDILTVLKHFPGHGSSEKDSHKGVVDVTNTWQQKELKPYRALIDSGKADMIMTAHIFNARWDSTWPATLSRAVITDTLRHSLGFEGVVRSDDLMMGAIRREYNLRTVIEQAINAGVDLLCFSNNAIYDAEIVPKTHQIITELVAEGKISKDRIDRSYRRIVKLKKRIAE